MQCSAPWGCTAALYPGLGGSLRYMGLGALGWVGRPPHRWTGELRGDRTRTRCTSMGVYVSISLHGLSTPSPSPLHPVGPRTAAGSAGIHRLPPKRCVSPQHPLKVGHPITAGGGSAAPPHPQPPGEGGRGGGRGGAADGDGAVQRCAGGGGGPSAPLRSAPLHPRPRGAEGRMMRER